MGKNSRGSAESENLRDVRSGEDEGNGTKRENLEADESGQEDDDERDSDESGETDCECNEVDEDDPWANFDDEEEDFFVTEEEKLAVLDDVLQLEDARMEWENR